MEFWVARLPLSSLTYVAEARGKLRQGFIQVLIGIHDSWYWFSDLATSIGICFCILFCYNFLWHHLIILVPWIYLQLLERLVMSMAEHELIEIQVFLCRFRHCKNILVFVESTIGVYSFTEVLAKDMTYATTVDLIYKKERCNMLLFCENLAIILML